MRKYLDAVGQSDDLVQTYTGEQIVPDTETQQPKLSVEDRAIVKNVARALWASDQPAGQKPDQGAFRAVSKEYMKKARIFIKRIGARGLEIVHKSADTAG